MAGIDAASDEVVASEWTSLLQPARDGTPSLASVYADYQASKQAVEGAEPGTAAAENHQEAEQTLAHHRVDIGAGALQIETTDRQKGTRVADDLADLDPQLWAKAHAAVRSRIQSSQLRWSTLSSELSPKMPSWSGIRRCGSARW
jgi:hypothetical protein